MSKKAKEFDPRDWDFSDPRECRKFLKSVRFGGPKGAQILYLTTTENKNVSIDEATDEQILDAVRQVCEKIPQDSKNHLH